MNTAISCEKAKKMRCAPEFQCGRKPLLAVGDHPNASAYEGRVHIHGLHAMLSDELLNNLENLQGRVTQRPKRQQNCSSWLTDSTAPSSGPPSRTSATSSSCHYLEARHFEGVGVTGAGEAGAV